MILRGVPVKKTPCSYCSTAPDPCCPQVPLACAVYRARGTPEYEGLLEKLPAAYRDGYHRIIQYGAQYVVTFFFAQRGSESILQMEVDDLVKEEGETLQFAYWREVIAPAFYFPLSTSAFCFLAPGSYSCTP